MTKGIRCVFFAKFMHFLRFFCLFKYIFSLYLAITQRRRKSRLDQKYKTKTTKILTLKKIIGYGKRGRGLAKNGFKNLHTGDIESHVVCGQ